jgi:LemA protein
MNGSSLLFFIAALVLICWIVGAKHRLIKLRQAIERHFLPLATQLHQRHQLIGALAEHASQNTALESTVIRSTQAACQQASSALEVALHSPARSAPITSLALAEQVLDAGLARLMGALQAQQNAQASAELVPLEALSSVSAKLSFTRQLFNAAVHDYNAAVQQIPTCWLCKALGFCSTSALPDMAPTLVYVQASQIHANEHGVQHAPTL